MLRIYIAPYLSFMQFFGNFSSSTQCSKSGKSSIRSITCLFVGNSPGGNNLIASKISPQCNFFMTAPEQALFLVSTISHLCEYSY